MVLWNGFPSTRKERHKRLFWYIRLWQSNPWSAFRTVLGLNVRTYCNRMKNSALWDGLKLVLVKKVREIASTVCSALMLEVGFEVLSVHIVLIICLTFICPGVHLSCWINLQLRLHTIISLFPFRYLEHKVMMKTEKLSLLRLSAP